MTQIVTQNLWIDVQFKQNQPFQLFAKSWAPAQLKTDIPIIMFHDSLGCVDLWRDFPAQLAEVTQRQVIAYDRLGFGQSPAYPHVLAHDFVVTEAQKIFKQLLEQLNIQKFIVMGHSVGGGMAAVCAALYPEQCISLITIAAQSHVEALTLSGIREAKAMFEQAGQLDRLKKYHGEKAQWVLNSWTETWLSEAFQHWTLDEYLQKIQIPMLVIHGELDEYGSLNQPQQFVDLSPAQTQLHIMENTHHMPHKEKPEEVLAVITTFLKKLTDFTPFNNTISEQI